MTSLRGTNRLLLAVLVLLLALALAPGAVTGAAAAAPATGRATGRTGAKVASASDNKNSRVGSGNRVTASASASAPTATAAPHADAAVVVPVAVEPPEYHSEDEPRNVAYFLDANGGMHGFDVDTRKYLGSFRQGPLVSTPKQYKTVPAVVMDGTSSSSDGGSNGRNGEGSLSLVEATEGFYTGRYLANPSDGSLFLMNEGRPVEKLGVNMRDLVNRSPYKSDANGQIVVGSHQTLMIAIDRNTSRVVRVFDVLQSNEKVAKPTRIPGDAVYMKMAKYTISFQDSSEEISNTTYLEYIAETSSSASSLADYDRFESMWQNFILSPMSRTLVQGPAIAIYIPDSQNRIHRYDFKQKAVSGDVGRPYVYVGFFGDEMMVLEGNLQSTQKVSDAVQSVWHNGDGAPDIKDALVPVFTWRDVGNGGAFFTVVEPPPPVIDRTDVSVVVTPIVETAGSNDSNGASTPMQTDEAGESSVLFNVAVAVTVIIASSAFIFVVWNRRGPTSLLSSSPSQPSASASSKKKKNKKRKPGQTGTGAADDNDLAEETDPTPAAATAQAAVAAGPVAEPAKSLLLDVSSEVLGRGSHGTIVFRGTFDGRAVAVKRLLSDFYDVAEREVLLLQDSDNHTNVIRYYYREKRDEFLYIALELCAGSLFDFLEPNFVANLEEGQRVLKMVGDGLQIVHKRKTICVPLDRLLADMLTGLAHLHNNNLVHRDVKPQNVLITPTGSTLISDFGLSKKLADDQSSFRTTANNGTLAWSAPETLSDELISAAVAAGQQGGDVSSSSNLSDASSSGDSDQQQRERRTKSVDVFSAGCVIFYVLTKGRHPFGESFERPVNIKYNRKNLSALAHNVEACDLVDKMTQHRPADRISMDQALRHPFFWDAQKRLAFLQEASDRFEILERDSPLVLTLETTAFSILGTSWHDRIDPIFLDNLGKYRKYQVGSVRDLLRAIRNKKHHYMDLPPEVQNVLGPLPDGFLQYFTLRFPLLLMNVYNVIAANPACRQDQMFAPFF